MGLLKLGLVGAAGYTIVRKYKQHTSNNPSTSTSRSPSPSDARSPFRDTKSGYQHQGFCNGQCGRTCNGEQIHGLHDSTCNGQCGGQCVTQRRTAGSPVQNPTNFVESAGAAPSYYVAGRLGEREMLPSYQRGSSPPVMGDVKK